MVIDAAALLTFLPDEPGVALVEAAMLEVNVISWPTGKETAGKLIGAGERTQQTKVVLSQTS